MTVACAPAVEPETTGPVALEVRIDQAGVQPINEALKTSRGQMLEITVTCAQPDSLHVHGYDVEVQCTPGQAASGRVQLDQSGVFEIETHETETVVARLTVT